MNEDYKKFDIKSITGIVYVLLVLVLLFLVFKIGVFLMPFVIAAIVVILTRPVVNFLNKKINLPTKIGNVIVIALFYILIIVVVTFLFAKITIEIYSMAMDISKNSDFIVDFIDKIIKEYEGKIVLMPDFLKNEIINNANNFAMSISSRILMILNKTLKFLTSLPELFVYFVITVFSTFLMAGDTENVKDSLKKQLPDIWVKKAKVIKVEVFQMIFVYAKSQLILIIMCFFEIFIGLTLINLFVYKLNYILVFALAIAIVDALPILGTGTVLVPWAIISYVNHDYLLAASLIALYLTTFIVRQISEPRLISKDIGTHPLLTLLSMYIGFKLFGVIGFLIGPIMMLILKNVFEKEVKLGFFKVMIGEQTEDDKGENNEKNN